MRLAEATPSNLNHVSFMPAVPCWGGGGGEGEVEKEEKKEQNIFFVFCLFVCFQDRVSLYSLAVLELTL